MKYSKTFITGCDSNTDWMLGWFLDNLGANTSTNIIVYDFGMSEEAKRVFAPTPLESKSVGWFKKPDAMIAASKLSEKVCWIDTDCHVQGPIDKIFEHIEPNKLSMVVDQPWTSRRQSKWHNSGVVGFQGLPPILQKWRNAVASNPKVGDQEVLHELLGDPLSKEIYIKDLPKKYNTLRLDLIDHTAPKDIRIMHWTGGKGKQHIQDLIKEDIDVRNRRP